MSANQITFPNDVIKNSWSELYKDVKKEVQDKDSSETLESRIRTLLKEKLGAEKIRNDDAYKKFFHEVIRLAVNMDTDNMLRRLDNGRLKYGENRHSKGKIEASEIGEDGDYVL